MITHVYRVVSIIPDDPEGEAHTEYVVGYYDYHRVGTSSPIWTPVIDCDTAQEAARWVMMLNGGYGKAATPVEKAKLAAKLLNEVKNDREALAAFATDMDEVIPMIASSMMEQNEALDDREPHYDDAMFDDDDDAPKESGS